MYNSRLLESLFWMMMMTISRVLFEVIARFSQVIRVIDSIEAVGTDNKSIDYAKQKTGV